MGHAGLRGAIAWALAVNFPSQNQEHIILAVSLCVLWTTFAHGLTIGPLLKRLKIRMGDDVDANTNDDLDDNGGRGGDSLDSGDTPAGSDRGSGRRIGENSGFSATLSAESREGRQASSTGASRQISSGWFRAKMHAIHVSYIRKWLVRDTSVDADGGIDFERL